MILDFLMGCFVAYLMGVVTTCVVVYIAAPGPDVPEGWR